MRGTVANKFSAIRGEMTPERRAKIDAKKREMLVQMRLYELRQARELTQQTIAENMNVPQSAISKIERRTDAYIGTIGRYLDAMGASLRIVARFPDGEEVENIAVLRDRRNQRRSGTR